MELQYSHRKIVPRLIVGLGILCLIPVNLGLRRGFPLEPDDPWAVVGATILFLGLIVLGVASTRLASRRPVVVIGADGISDRRLPLGAIPWKDVTGARLLRAYGSTLLLLTVVTPEEYARRLPILKRALARRYKSDHNADLYIDLTELDARCEDVLEEVKRRLPE